MALRRARGLDVISFMVSWKRDQLDALVEDTIDGYEAFLPPEAMAALRQELGGAFELHPTLAPLVDELLHRPEKAESGEVPLDDEVAPSSEKPSKNSGGKG